MSEEKIVINSHDYSLPLGILICMIGWFMFLDYKENDLHGRINEYLQAQTEYIQMLTRNGDK